MEFYQTVFGGKLDMTTFKEGGMPIDESENEKIMHGMLESENGLTFMAADTPIRMEYKAGANISMSLSGDNEEEFVSTGINYSEGGRFHAA